MCLAYRLSLKLGKSFIFSQRFEFVGNDVCPEGNRPAQSKHQLLESWPQPDIIRNVAKFIGFAQFYSKYIPHFKLRVAPLRALTTNHEYTVHVTPFWTDACRRSFDDIRHAILLDPCLAHFNHRRLIVLARTSCPKALATSYASRGLMRHPRPQWSRTAPARTSAS